MFTVATLMFTEIKGIGLVQIIINRLIDWGTGQTNLNNVSFWHTLEKATGVHLPANDPCQVISFNKHKTHVCRG